jgi:hypothetical protein
MLKYIEDKLRTSQKISEIPRDGLQNCINFPAEFRGEYGKGPDHRT